MELDMGYLTALQKSEEKSWKTMAQPEWRQNDIFRYYRLRARNHNLAVSHKLNALTNLGTQK
jgi:hypothetical protein